MIQKTIIPANHIIYGITTCGTNIFPRGDLSRPSINNKPVTINITHNPITMAKMNRLFGVTMGEKGVSQLVSVDLDTAEELVEA